MRKKYKFNGNAYDRRKTRRYLNRVILPLVDANVSLAEIAQRTGISFQRIQQHLYNEGYVQAGWMYRPPLKPTQLAA